MTEKDSSDANTATRRFGALDKMVSERYSNGQRVQNDTLTVQEETGDGSRRATEGVSRPERDHAGDDSDRIAQEYADIMRQCANGDLTLRMERAGADDAMDRIAANFNGMVIELEQTTGHLKSYVEEVEEAGDGIERSATTVRRASQEVVDSMQTISSDMADQRDQLGAVSETMDAVAAALEMVAGRNPDAELQKQIARLEQTASEVRDAAETSEGVRTETRVVSTAIEAQSAELSEVSNRAGELQRYAHPLGAMLDRFTTESDQESGTEPGAAEEGTSD